MKYLLKAVILPVEIAGVGGYAAYTYNQPKLNIDYANVFYGYLRDINQAISTTNKSLLRYENHF